MLTPYPGYMPSVVNRDAKYSIVHAGQGLVVRLIYRLGFREEALLTTENHPELVQRIARVKGEIGSGPGGVFYLNEFGHVLVPNPTKRWGDRIVEGFYAGSYSRFLEFTFQGKKLGPVPSEDLRTGDEWDGPHTGIPYVLSADGRDIFYRRTTPHGTEQKMMLSDIVGRSPAVEIARRLGQFKGPSGGRVYVNEARHFFAPVMTEGTLRYLYIGSLGEDPWFPEPRVNISSST